MRGTRLAAAVLLAVAVALTGCGGDDGDGDGLSKEELDERSGAICRDGRQELNDLSEPDLSNPEETATFLGDAVAIFDRTLGKLRGLEPEEDLKADYDAYLGLVEENGDSLREILDKAKAKDPTGRQDLVRLLNDRQRDRQTKAAARKAGLTGCANT